MSAFDNVPVRLRNLPVDLYLECKIYSKKPSDANRPNEEDFSLLCENQTLTQGVIDRLKRTVFPSSMIHLPRQGVISGLFDKGHNVGYSDDDVRAIRDGKKPWVSKKPTSVSTKSSSKGESSHSSSKVKSDSNAGFFKKKFQIKRFGEVIELYNKTKDITENMLSTAAATGKIDKEQSAAITKDVQEQLGSTDVSLIIQTINQIRTADQYLHSHCLNVAFLNGLMGRWMMLDSQRQNELVEVGLFHDIGKLSIAPEILNKPAELNEEEFSEIEKHPSLSVEMLIKSGVRNKAVLEGVAQHHERFNGTGYPKGLVAEEICEYARITAISDTYDAMVTDRFHDNAHSPFVILNEFGRGGYSELELRYVNVFINCMIDELQGKEIIMNDGSEAVVLLVDPRRLLYPIVEVEGRVVSTDSSFYCVRMKNMLS
ncbi:MAG: HD domain-containing protein [Oscillospiraceae bacterium]|nr:HD domain-containing protein [Oscillospiraceae bacterium]